MRKLTEKGRLFEERIEAEKDHLLKVREAAARQGGVSRSTRRNEEEGDENEGVSDDDENPFVAGGFENVDSLAMAATLDADDYFQWDVDSLSEATLLLICSNVCRDPHDEGYDMSVPPANYWEAEQQTDAEEWKKVTEKDDREGSGGFEKDGCL